MTDQMKKAAMGEGGGLQSITGAVGEAASGGLDMRNSSSKKADQAGQDLGALGKSAGQTSGGTSVGGDQQVGNMGSGSADHLGLGMRKT